MPSTADELQDPQTLDQGTLYGSATEQRLDKSEAVQTEAQREQLRGFMEAVFGQCANGRLRIERTGPWNLPDAERGLLEKVPVLQIGQDPEDYVRDRHGGGEYELTPVLPTGRLLRDLKHHVRIRGEPKVQSAEGRAWLKREFPDEYGDDRGESQPLSVEKVLEFMERIRTSEGGSQAQVVAQFTQLIERDRAQREEADRRRQEREEREAKARAEREERRATRELEQLRIDMQERLRKIEIEAEERRAEAQRRHELELERMKTDSRSQLEMLKLQGTGGMGMGMFKRMGAEILDMYREVGQSMIAGEEPAGDWGDIVRHVAKEAGPEAVKELSGALRAWSERRGGKPPPLPRSGERPALPSAAGGDAGGEAAARREASSADSERARVAQVVKALHQELLRAEDPAGAWKRELGQAFAALPEAWQQRFEGGGWAGLSSPLDHAHHLVATIDALLEEERRRTWHQAFYDARPWAQGAAAADGAEPGSGQEAADSDAAKGGDGQAG